MSPEADTTRQAEGAETPMTRRERLAMRRAVRESKREEGSLRSQKARGWMEKLLTRTLTGAIYAIIVLACLWFGTLPTALLFAAMGWLCCSELLHMVRMSGRMPNEFLALGATVLFPLLAFVRPVYLIGVLFIHFMACAVWYESDLRVSLGDVAITFFAPFYTGLMFSAIVYIRQAHPGYQGALLAMGVVGGIWANDAFAYLIGSRFGKTKLAPKISPNKSWEGLWGGLAGSVLVWAVVAGSGVCQVSWPLAITTGILSAVSGIVGDLFESRIKRGVGVKDSGNIMPGHGGMLDRSDALIFGATTAYIILRLGGII